MKITNNTDAPQGEIHWKHVFLVALHVIVLLLSLSAQEFRTTEVAPRALP